MQAFGERPQQFNGRFEIPTLEEVIALVKRKSREQGRTIGIYPETKHPTYHRDLGLPLEPRLVQALRAAGWDRRDAPVFIQSFEQSNLKALRRMTPVRLVQLVDANDVNPDGSLDYTAPFDRPYDWTVSGDPRLLARTFAFFATDEGLREIRTYADGIGPWKRYIVSTAAADLDGDGVVGDENGDGVINEADRACSRRPTSSRARTGTASSSTRGRSATSSAGSPPTTAATPSTSTCSSIASASTACSRTLPTPRWSRACCSSSSVIATSPSASRAAAASAATDDAQDR